VLAITGANDPRVAPWIVAKFAARLQAATSSGKPVLLRVDYDAGHGYLGSSRAQAQALATRSGLRSCCGSSAIRRRDGLAAKRAGNTADPLSSTELLVPSASRLS